MIAFGCAPSAIISAAQVWRRWWNVGAGSMSARSTAGAQKRRPKVVRRRYPPSGAGNTRSPTGVRSWRCRPSSSARNAGIVTARRLSRVFSGPTYSLPLTSEEPSSTCTRHSSSARCLIRKADASPNLKAPVRAEQHQPAIARIKRVGEALDLLDRQESRSSPSPGLSRDKVGASDHLRPEASTTKTEALPPCDQDRREIQPKASPIARAASGPLRSRRCRRSAGERAPTGQVGRTTP